MVIVPVAGEPRVAPPVGLDKVTVIVSSRLYRRITANRYIKSLSRLTVGKKANVPEVFT